MGEPRCRYVYNGRNGGRRGQACGRPEDEHCKGRTDHCDNSHDDDCNLNLYDSRVRSRQKVHHSFHRPKQENANAS